MSTSVQKTPISGYETTIIIRQDLSDEGIKTLHDKLTQVIQSFDGEMVLNENWGKRKMAYSIKKESKGHYSYLVYSGKGKVVHEIERHLRIHEHVLRFLTVQLNKDFSAEEFKKNRAEYYANKKRRDDEREARREEKHGGRSYSDDRKGGMHDDSMDIDLGSELDE